MCSRVPNRLGLDLPAAGTPFVAVTMVGGGSRKDKAGNNGVSNSNVFAALDSLRKKKKSEQSKGKGGVSSKQGKEAEGEQVYWAPAPLTVKSWADVDDDDDYFATAAPPQIPAAWGNSEPPKSKETDDELQLEEEIESEDDGLDDGDGDIDDDQENEPEVQVPNETSVKEPSPPSVAQKETERQLSKKELKKKELAELDAVLAELGITDKDKTNSASEEHQVKKTEPPNEDAPKDNASAPSESKTSKKKKKKDKASKEGKDAQEQPDSVEVNTPDEEGTNQADDASNVDMKERLKKMASMKKKKSNKEMDAAAKSAAAEAAARSARLAAAKKKEKSHYNQQPVR